MDRKSPPSYPPRPPLPSTPTSSRRGPTHSPHTPVSSLSHLQLSNAPIKSNPFNLHDQVEDDPRKSPSIGSGRKGKARLTQSARPVKSVFAAAVKGITQSEPRPPAFSIPRNSNATDSGLNYRFPGSSSSVEEDSFSRRPSEASTVDLEAFFGEKLQATPRSLKKAYIAPHRRQESQESSRRSSFASDTSGLPEQEDNFYTSIISPLTLNPPVLEYGKSYQQLSSTPRSNNSIRRIAPPSLSFGYPSTRPPLPPTPRSRQLEAVGMRRGIDPPYSPPATRIARLPYDEPLLYHHPASIAEEESEEGGRYHQSKGSSLKTQELDGDDTPTVANFSSSIQQFDPPLQSQTMFSLAESEESFDSNSETEEVPNSCSSCAAPPAASFVALYPCDHLLCYKCMNTLINSAAHKPPRETCCFECGIFIKTFYTAWVGGEGNMLEALEDSLDEADLYDGNHASWEQEEFRNSTRIISKGRNREGGGEIGSRTDYGFVSEEEGERSRSNSLFNSANSTNSSRDRPVGMDSGIGIEIGSLGKPKDPPVTFIQPHIPIPFEWPVLRLDNIPWDVTVDELEEWLPLDSLAPEKNCVLAVHILCNRSDGRTLNQCFIEAASISTARKIVRHRNGRLLGDRAVHITLSTQGEFMSTVFPSWTSGFNGMNTIAPHVNGPAPLVLLNELTGLLLLCKLGTNHAAKVPERGFFNIVTLLQKFPWHIPSAYNSKQIVRLFETTCAAIEILMLRRAHIPDWRVILTTLVDAALFCPVFRDAQKQKIERLSGISPSGNSSAHEDSFDPATISQLNYDPPSLKEKFVTVVARDNRLSLSPPLSAVNFDLAARGKQDEVIIESPVEKRVNVPSYAQITSNSLSTKSSIEIEFVHPDYSTYVLQSPTSVSSSETEDDSTYPPIHSTKSGIFNSPSPSPIAASLGFTTRRRAASIALALGVEVGTVKAVAAELGVNFGKKLENSPELEGMATFNPLNLE